MKLTALLSAGLLLFAAAPASADLLYQDPFSYDPIGGRTTYNQGEYSTLNQNDFGHSPFHDRTIRDSNGNYYDCGQFGQCWAR
jgi:predicted secreted Zn-dependent protease